MKELAILTKKEIDEDNEVSKEDPERKRFDTLFDWMRQGGSKFDKLKVRYYGPDYRGVHSSRDIKRGEVIMCVPKKQLITLEMAMTSPIGYKMFTQNFR